MSDGNRHLPLRVYQQLLVILYNYNELRYSFASHIKVNAHFLRKTRRRNVCCDKNDVKRWKRKKAHFDRKFVALVYVVSPTIAYV